MAVIHADAFPAGESWGADAIFLQLALPGVFGLIAPAGGMLLARVASDEAELLTLAVMPAARRQGLGSALVRAAMREAAARGARTMFLEVSEANNAARGLYAASGFAEVGRRSRYYRNGAAALVLRAALSGPGAVTSM